jgi:molybdopterin molybdotransferase
MSQAAPLQLKNLSVEEARGRMLADALLLGVETVPLAQALGRTLAQAIDATRDQPPFAASAMDGWAIRRVDLTPDARFRIVGESAAGRAYPASSVTARPYASSPARQSRPAPTW